MRTECSSELGAVCFHPVLLYDFFSRKNDPPIKAAEQGSDYRASQGTLLKRLTLLRCAEDTYYIWRPTDEEVNGIKRLGYPAKLMTLKKHFLTSSKPFGKFHHDYSQLLAPLMNDSDIKQLSERGIPQLLEFADFSTESDKFSGRSLSLFGVISLRRFGDLLSN